MNVNEIFKATPVRSTKPPMTVESLLAWLAANDGTLSIRNVSGCDAKEIRLTADGKKYAHMVSRADIKSFRGGSLLAAIVERAIETLEGAKVPLEVESDGDE